MATVFSLEDTSPVGKCDIYRRKDKTKNGCSGAGIEPTDTAVNRITTTFANALTPRIRNALSDKAAMEEDLMFAILSCLLQLPMRESVYCLL
ncbi:hypothetical protein TNCV_3782651 [Trichonephila clavipes]|nr:hypothetical protein TNCV_3782651 [Trichonephila clavipes]